MVEGQKGGERERQPVHKCKTKRKQHISPAESVARFAAVRRALSSLYLVLLLLVRPSRPTIPARTCTVLLKIHTSRPSARTQAHSFLARITPDAHPAAWLLLLPQHY
jgi:hypothetical protein